MEFSIVTSAKSGTIGEKSARLPTKVQLRRSPRPSKSAIAPHGPLVWLLKNVEFSTLRSVPSACRDPPITAVLLANVDLLIWRLVLWK